MKTLRQNPLHRVLPLVGATVLAVSSIVVSSTAVLAEGGTLTERSKAVASDAKAVMADAGQSVATGAGNAWQALEESALSSRTQDEIIAWMVVGALVGAVAGMLTSMKSTGMGRFGRLLLGLMGAFIGGVAVRVGNVDLGWNPLLIRYEELLCAFLGAVVLIVLARVARAATQKKHA
jgi:uncharacterized membrane protein YeaQ/YmgE (transglycosylase-associated protein family)